MASATAIPSGNYQAWQWTANSTTDHGEYFGWWGIGGDVQPPNGRVPYLSDFSTTWLAAAHYNTSAYNSNISGVYGL